MHKFARRNTTVENACVALFKDHHATAFDSVVGRIDGGGYEIRKAHVRNEASAFFDLQNRILSLFPCRDTDFAAEKPCFNPDVRQRLGERERATPDLPVFARLGW